MNRRILLIRTGGTIDSKPYDDPKKPPQYVNTLSGSESLIMPTIKKLPNHENVDGFTWLPYQESRFVKDNQLFTKQDIDELATLIKNDDHELFVISHGTDAMVKNALILQEKLLDSGKVVAFTGAMVPLSMHEKHRSDGLDSLRFSLEHIMSKEPSVYVVGRDEHTRRLDFFNPADVQKDIHESAYASQLTFKAR